MGPTLYKNLKPEMIPRIYFAWTGFEVDMSDPRVAGAVKDKTGELHLKKLAGFFGAWEERLDYVIRHVREVVAAERRPLVVSESVAEVVNLTAMWKNFPRLYTELPIPTPADIERIDREERAQLQERVTKLGERIEAARLKSSADNLREQHAKLLQRLNAAPLTADIPPVLLPPEKLKKALAAVATITTQLRIPSSNPVKRQQLQEKLGELHARLLRHEMANAIRLEFERRQRQYIRDLLAAPGEVGMLVEEVDPEVRLAFVRDMQVNFVIGKYGKEGLDNPRIDTLFMLEPCSSRNPLQQFMGRPCRWMEGKKTPVVVIMEDNVGPLIHMCVQLRSHLSGWPADEGGPFTYELVGHPPGQRRKGCLTKQLLVPGSW